MRATGPLNRAWTGAGAFFTLLALGLLAPGPSLADCVHPGDRPTVAGDLFGLEGTTGAVRPADPAPPPPPKPCSGPQCSGRSGIPPATATPQAPTRSDSWAIAPEVPPVARPDSAAATPEDDLDRPARFAPPIFHPPRLPR